MHLRHSLAVWGIVACVVSGCDKQIPQTVVGTINTAAGPASNIAVRLYPSFRTCEGQFLEGRTDASGRFSFFTESTRGGLSVVVQHLALCTEVAGKWQPLWSIVTGGGATRVVLNCQPQKNDEGENCESEFTYG